jgi:ElaB/YqjD/DUF883 family membrane-anchored ribosome-binding protein
MRWIVVLAMTLAMASAFGCGEEKKSEIQEKQSVTQEKKSVTQETESVVQEKKELSPEKIAECRNAGETLCKQHHKEGEKGYEPCISRYINSWCK